MANRNVVPGLFPLGDNLWMQIGTATFTTTGTQVTMRTNLETISCGIAVPIGAVVTSNDVCGVTGSVSSSTVTITRPASGTSALSVSVMLIGTLYTAGA